jgi:hypothetical protein
MAWISGTARVDREGCCNQQRAVGEEAMTLPEQIRDTITVATTSEKEMKEACLLLAAHIERLEAKVEQLERFLPHHFQAPTALQAADDIGVL